MEIIHETPSPSSYTPLSTHQSQTPSSFYSTTPVLYHSSTGASLLLLSTDLSSHTLLTALAGQPPATTNGAATTNGDTTPSPADHSELLIPNIDIWVTSERFIIYNPLLSSGLSIPYPSISLHAIQRLRLPECSAPDDAPEVQGLFMQIDTSDGYDDHDEDATLSMTLIPSPTVPDPVPSPEAAASSPVREAQVVGGGVGAAAGAGRSHPESPVRNLFAAISTCANLHPDPISAADGDDAVDEGEMESGHPPFMFESGIGYETSTSTTDTVLGLGLPPPMPGSGGWITAENVGEFFDEEGNFRGGRGGGAQGIGPGAGVVRGREEEGEEGGRWEDVDGGGDGEGNGNGDAGETKWRRTE